MLILEKVPKDTTSSGGEEGGKKKGKLLSFLQLGGKKKNVPLTFFTIRVHNAHVIGPTSFFILSEKGAGTFFFI